MFKSGEVVINNNCNRIDTLIILMKLM